ncbi:hypothetical protein LF1_31040 [Rubripirellula obstinata]|uniref:Zinc-finger domain-containing protein n=2 Tax=Rubripirellula obstinata TaxID=406547 RepID=A0A5B1CMR4_9BACT|nr:hypothetical protein LF1_31040 [Rubripirellula obstinata]
MDCNEFQRQFQRSLDRRDASPNREMQSHANQCASCQHQVQLWQSIETSLASKTYQEPQTNQSKSIKGRSIVAVAVAASLAIAFATQRTTDPIAESQSPDSQSLTSIDSQTNASKTDLATSITGPQLDPSIWWNDIRDRDWVGRTLPTVRIVSDGVAPLGRSIQRAATLLTTAPREQTS